MPRTFPHSNSPLDPCFFALHGDTRDNFASHRSIPSPSFIMRAMFDGDKQGRSSSYPNKHGHFKMIAALLEIHRAPSHQVQSLPERTRENPLHFPRPRLFWYPSFHFTPLFPVRRLFSFLGGRGHHLGATPIRDFISHFHHLIFSWRWRSRHTRVSC